MATSREYIEFVCEQIRGPYAVYYRKMFGEYMVYLNEKPVLLVCDGTPFVKMLPELSDLMADAPRGCPYDGAKEHYILDVEDPALTEQVLAILERTAAPKVKKHKKSEQI